MKCPICDTENTPEASTCQGCGFSLSFGGPGWPEFPTVKAPDLADVLQLSGLPEIQTLPLPIERVSPEDDALVSDLEVEKVETSAADTPPSDHTSEKPAKALQYLDQAYAHEEEGKFQAALQECEAAIALAPGWAEAHNLRGIILDDLHETKNAVEAYRQAVQLDPEFEEARENLAGAEAELRTSRSAPDLKFWKVCFFVYGLVLVGLVLLAVISESQAPVAIGFIVLAWLLGGVPGFVLLRQKGYSLDLLYDIRDNSLSFVESCLHGMPRIFVIILGLLALLFEIDLGGLALIPIVTLFVILLGSGPTTWVIALFLKPLEAKTERREEEKGEHAPYKKSRRPSQKGSR